MYLNLKIYRPYLWATMIYSVFVFPFAYFRHDDWWILGNALIELPKNWTFLLSPTLYQEGKETIWFFRPLFKFFVYFFHKIFGWQYSYWLFALWGFTLGAVYLAQRCLLELGQTIENAYFFSILFLFSFHLHFGSQFWMGEGMMNCPQIFFIFLSLWAFLKSVSKNTKFGWVLLSISAYLVALGFKESAVFHYGFLVLIVFLESPFRQFPVIKKLQTLLPLTIVTAFYLGIRLFVMPLNPQYVSTFHFSEVPYSAGLLVGSIALPLLIIVLFKNTPIFTILSVKKGVPYLLMLLFSLFPYIGHDFFSPGWLLIPGFYAVFILALSLDPVRPIRDTIQLKYLSIACLGLTLTIVTSKLILLDWWQWNIGQKQIVAFVNTLDPRMTDAVVIHDCNNAKNSSRPFKRVVGFEASLYELIQIFQGEPKSVKIKDCGKVPLVKSPKPKVVHLVWNFPILSQLD